MTATDPKELSPNFYIDEGFNSFYHGAALDDNPYTGFDSERAQDWEQGYREGLNDEIQ